MDVNKEIYDMKTNKKKIIACWNCFVIFPFTPILQRQLTDYILINKESEILLIVYQSSIYIAINSYSNIKFIQMERSHRALQPIRVWQQHIEFMLTYQESNMELWNEIRNTAESSLFRGFDVRGLRGVPLLANLHPHERLTK